MLDIIDVQLLEVPLKTLPVVATASLHLDFECIDFVLLSPTPYRAIKCNCDFLFVSDRHLKHRNCTIGDVLGVYGGCLMVSEWYLWKSEALECIWGVSGFSVLAVRNHNTILAQPWKGHFFHLTLLKHQNEMNKKSQLHLFTYGVEGFWKLKFKYCPKWRIFFPE